MDPTPSRKMLCCLSRKELTGLTLKNMDVPPDTEDGSLLWI